MADKKISELDAITGANTAATDVFVVVDTSTGQTKKITREELNNAIEQDVLSTVDINGGTIDGTTIGGTTAAAGSFTTVDATGNITVAGTVDGRDVATDGAKLDGIEASATADQTGAEIATALNGETISSLTALTTTGAVIVGGDLTVNGTTTTINSTTLTVDDKNIELASGAADAAAANGAGITIDGASATFNYASTGDKWTFNKTIDVTGDVIASGDLTVDTNTLHVDSTNNRVGIGTTSPDRLLTLQGDNSYMWIKDAGGGNTAFIGSDGTNDGWFRLYDSSHNIKVEIESDGVTYFNGGNVGIGDTAPVTPLTIATTNKLGSTFTGTTNGEGLTVTQTNYTAGNYISLVEAAYDDSGDANPNVRIGAMFDGNGSNLAFGTSNSYSNGITNEALRIDSAGALQIGGTSNSGFIDFDSQSLQLNTQRNPNTGTFSNTGKSHASIVMNGASGGSDIKFYTANANNTTATQRMTIDSSGDVDMSGNLTVGDGTNKGRTSPSTTGHLVIDGNGYDGAITLDGTGMHIYHNSSIRDIIFGINSNEYFRMTGGGTANGKFGINNNNPSYTLDGSIGTTASSATHFRFKIGSDSYGGAIWAKQYYGYCAIGRTGGNAEGIRFENNAVSPADLDVANGFGRDNAMDLGTSSNRWDDVRATNGTIQTSDQNLKQNIAVLTDAEITAAKAISGLFKTFKWIDKVEAKGDDARTHTGVIAQEVRQAMTDNGLDATKYAFWCSDTWWEAEQTATTPDGDEVTGTVTFNSEEEAPEGATQVTRLSIRYPELLAFIGAATEQRLTNIETRLTALEAE